MYEMKILSLCWPTLLPAANQHHATINELKNDRKWKLCKILRKWLRKSSKVLCRKLQACKCNNESLR